MDAPTTHWLSVGISNNRFMALSDTYTGWVGDVDGMPHVLDEWAPAQTQPSLAPQQSATVLASRQHDGRTTITFRRALDTGDANADIAIVPGAMYLLFAYDTRYEPDSGYYGQHSTKGAVLVVFIATTTTTATTIPGQTTVTTTTTTTAGIPLPLTAPVFESSANNFRVWWEISGSTVTFTINGVTSGWVAIGLSEDELMAGL
jgi:hypothetical protein